MQLSVRKQNGTLFETNCVSMLEVWQDEDSAEASSGLEKPLFGRTSLCAHL